LKNLVQYFRHYYFWRNFFMDFERLLQQHHPSLTPAQRRAADYILAHYDEAIFQTISELSRKAGVSEATVIRLTRTLGFEGYPGLQRMLRDSLQDRLSTVTRVQESIRHAKDDGDILSKIIQQDIRNLTQTLQSLSRDAFQQAVEDLLSARRIFVVGLRGSHAPALILSLYLQFLRKDVHLIAPGYGDVWNQLLGIGPDDLVIGISFPRYTRLTVEILEYAKEQGTRVGAISDSPLSPLATAADWVLPVSSSLDSFIESFSAAVSVANALLTAVSVRNPEETVKALKAREAIWTSRKIYMVSAKKK
jgi:DNA-binding MurR/RpiR family transcriptional regulator